MVQPLSARFEEVLALALRLSPAERIAIIEQLAASFRATEPAERLPGEDNADAPPDNREAAELLRPDPLSPAQIAELDLLGAWADLGIADGAEWVNAQKRKRSERSKW